MNEFTAFLWDRRNNDFLTICDRTYCGEGGHLEKKMKYLSFRIKIFILIGVLFLSVSSVYAETADEYYNRGLAQSRQGNLPEAISDYTKAIEIKPDYAEAYYNRGLAYGRQGNHPQAISEYTKAIEIKPDYAEAYKSRWASYFMIKEYDKAWTDVHKAEELGHAVHPTMLKLLKTSSGRDE